MGRVRSIRIRGRRYFLRGTAVRDKGHGHTDSNWRRSAEQPAPSALSPGKGKGALLGGLLGAGVGTSVAAATGGQPAPFSAELVYDFTLTHTAQARPRTDRL